MKKDEEFNTALRWNMPLSDYRAWRLEQMEAFIASLASLDESKMTLEEIAEKAKELLKHE